MSTLPGPLKKKKKKDFRKETRQDESSGLTHCLWIELLFLFFFPGPGSCESWPFDTQDLSFLDHWKACGSKVMKIVLRATELPKSRVFLEIGAVPLNGNFRSKRLCDPTLSAIANRLRDRPRERGRLGGAVHGPTPPQKRATIAVTSVTVVALL
jgi:hypothetical protein